MQVFLLQKIISTSHTPVKMSFLIKFLIGLVWKSVFNNKTGDTEEKLVQAVNRNILQWSLGSACTCLDLTEGKDIFKLVQLENEKLKILENKSNILHGAIFVCIINM